MTLKNRVNRLFDKLEGERVRIYLSNNESIYLNRDQLLELYNEATKHFDVVDNEGNITETDKKDLSDRAQKIGKYGIKGQDKVIDMLIEAFK